MNAFGHIIRRTGGVFALCVVLFCGVPAVALAKPAAAASGPTAAEPFSPLAGLRAASSRPPAPRMKSVSNVVIMGEPGVMCTWSAVPGAKYYTLYRADTATARTRIYVCQPPANCTRAIRQTRMSDPVGQMWYYSLRVTTSKGTSPFSKAFLGVSNWTAPALDTPFIQPDKKTRLRWAPIPNATGYRIWSSTSSKMTRAVSVATKSTGASVPLRSASGTTYYQVAATRDTFTGPKSAPIGVKPAPLAVTTYRALLVGNNDYPLLSDMKGVPWVDAAQFKNALGLFRMKGHRYSVRTVVKDRTALQIQNDIATAFAGADKDDVSLFYYSGRGGTFNGSYYLCGVDSGDSSDDTGHLTIKQLRTALDAVPGRVIVILNSAHSGGFIKRGTASVVQRDDADAFNQAVVNAFADATSTVPASAAQLKGRRAQAFNVPKFLVMTSCRGSETSKYNVKVGTFFTASLLRGIGWRELPAGKLPTMAADVNRDKRVTFHEAYVYAAAQASKMNPKQTAQVYPAKSKFVFYAR